MFTSKKSLKKRLCFDEVTRLRTSAFRKVGVCMSEQSLIRRSAPYKSDQQHQEKDERTSYNQQGVFNVIEYTILQSDVF